MLRYRAELQSLGSVQPRAKVFLITAISVTNLFTTGVSVAQTRSPLRWWSPRTYPLGAELPSGQRLTQDSDVLCHGILGHEPLHQGLHESVLLGAELLSGQRLNQDFDFFVTMILMEAEL